MTEQEKQELSKALADKYGIRAFYREESSPTYDYPCGDSWNVWLHDDSARCFDLMVDRRIQLTNTEYCARVEFLVYHPLNAVLIEEGYPDHPTKQEATRIAILKALLAKD